MKNLQIQVKTNEILCSSLTGIFDDLNPQTRGQWAYPDIKQWDPDRNTREFIEAMAAWREHGLLSFTINLQGVALWQSTLGQFGNCLRWFAKGKFYEPARTDPRQS